MRARAGRAAGLARGAGWNCGAVPVASGPHCQKTIKDCSQFENNYFMRLLTKIAARGILRYSSQFKNNYFTSMCSGSEAGSYVRLIDFVYHSTLDLREKKKKNAGGGGAQPDFSRDC